jgi:predicted transcriptional regulator
VKEAANMTIAASAQKDEERKRLYEQFGRTFAMAFVLENELANALLVLGLRNRVTNESRKQGKEGKVDRSTYTAMLDAYIAELHGLTMRKLIKRLLNEVPLDGEFKKRLDYGRCRRDHLAHQFWRVRAGELTEGKDTKRAIEELERDEAYFQRVSQEVNRVMQAGLQKYGFDTEAISAKIESEVQNIAQSE